MDLNIFQRLSLKTRVTFFTVAIFLLGIWLLAFYASRMLRQDMERLLGEQQFSTVSFMAAEIDHELTDRLGVLENVAGIVSPAVLENTAALQTLLEQRLILRGVFNGGVLAYRLDGTAIAEVPLSAGRIGVNDIDRDYIATALKEGKSMIGRPVVGKKLLVPVFGMAVPIRDTQGKVIGALAGVTNLEKLNFLDKITATRYGKTGGYLLVAPQNRQIVAATDKSRIIATLPVHGVNPMIDGFIHGEGSAVGVNPLGVEVLASHIETSAAGWHMVAELPTAEAFAPIRAMQQRMLLAAIFLTLLAGILTWWMLRHQFSPMLAAMKQLANMSDENQQLRALPITRRDEIGHLIGGFNRLLKILGQREDALCDSHEALRSILKTTLDGYWQVDGQGILLDVNPTYSQQSGYVREELLGVQISDLETVESAADTAKHIQRCIESRSVRFESMHRRKDGSTWQVEVNITYSDVAGGQFFAFLRDITERKEAEKELRVAAIAFESQEGMFITDAEKVILRVNLAFSDITGYPAEEAVGQKPSLFSSGLHKAAFFAAMTKSIQHSGAWQGEIWNRRKSGEVYPQWLTITAVTDSVGEITNYVATLNDITSRKTAEDEIKNLAFYDPLTRLPNRRLLLDRLKQALASSTRNEKNGALLFIDLDNFKTINDTLGHNIGDLLLQKVAQRLVSCVREGDTVARLGGDEFLVMLEDLSEDLQESAANAKIVGEKILASLGQTYLLAGHDCYSTPSIGVTMFADHRETIDELMKQADLAMYQAKAAGRNTLRFFDPEMQDVVTTRAALEADLREAILRDQFLLYYQAQVDGMGRVMGVEALLRWQHPQRGLVPPLEFIPLAEDSGLILPLGHWVLKTACVQLVAWAAQPKTAHLTIAVNVSARQFHHRDFVDQVLAVLVHTGANPNLLKLELTESLLVNDVEDVIVKMNALRATGVGFSLDDFGTGYSSLSYLKRLPLDQLKIDQGFVRDILIDSNDAAIAKMVVALAESLGLAVIAEGVEAEEQRNALALMGCHAYQGYLFSRPLPLEEFEEFIGGGLVHLPRKENLRHVR